MRPHVPRTPSVPRFVPRVKPFTFWVYRVYRLFPYVRIGDQGAAVLRGDVRYTTLGNGALPRYTRYTPIGNPYLSKGGSAQEAILFPPRENPER